MSTPEGKFSRKEAIALIHDALAELKGQVLKRDVDIKDLDPLDSDTIKMKEQNALYQAKIEALSLLVQKPNPTTTELKEGQIGIKKSQESTAEAWAGAAAHYAKKGLHRAANMLAEGSKSLIENATGLKNILAAAEFKKAADTQISLIKEISEHVSIIKKAADDMTEARKKANTLDSAKKQAHAYCEKVKPFFETIRYNVDKLENIVDDATWPLPKYREMLYLR